MPKIPVVSEVLTTINSGIKYLTLLTKTSHVRRLRKAVDYAEQFIFLCEELKEVTDNKVIDRGMSRLAYLKKKFFKFNQ